MHHAVRRYFEGVELGDDLGSLHLSISRQTTVDLCRLWGFPMPNRFTDDDVARREGMESAVVPSPLVLGYMALLVSRWAADAHVKRLDVVLRGHLGHDQQVQVVGVVTDKDDSGDIPEIHCDLVLKSLEGVGLVSGQAVVELPSRLS